MRSNASETAQHYAGKVAVVTGASSGIGQALVVQLIASGARVFAVGRDAGRLARLYTLSGADRDQLVTGSFDVQDEAACAQLIQQCVSVFGGLDVLFCNAGQAMKGAFLSASSPQASTAIMRVNYDPVVYLSFHALPHLIRSQGHITVTGGIVSHVGLPEYSAYCASKHAVRGFIESLRREVSAQGVSLTLASPDTVRTAVRDNMLDASGEASPLGYGDEKAMSPDHCAALILQATQRQKSHVLLSRRAKILNLLQFALPCVVQKILSSSFERQRKAGVAT
ncbi:SDR family oxidoreductase [Pseudomonas sp. zfem002]|uniref:SDR family oxidoreductase n=1 Tax=Pseudomonas sp. zfem002 TaxID=3078197 RepID=UPI002927A94C|nr:SDR family oxidoreductase [Pseudomonas sp. zfem002]MDU9391289.1 SDR family oxidoreductase [Pseudomonas sp. zfem002]